MMRTNNRMREQSMKEEVIWWMTVLRSMDRETAMRIQDNGIVSKKSQSERVVSERHNSFEMRVLRVVGWPELRVVG